MGDSDFNAIVRVAVVLMACFGLLVWCESRGHTETLTLSDRLVLAQRHLPASKKDPEQVDPVALAAAVAEASKGDRTIAAALYATAWAETTLSDRLHRNECRPRECDWRRAWGLWQQHKDGFTRDDWGSPDVRVQAKQAARAMRSAFWTCKAAHAPFPAGMLRLYGGRACNAPDLPREAVRVAAFNQVRARL